VFDLDLKIESRVGRVSNQGNPLRARYALTYEGQPGLALQPRHGRHAGDIPTRSLQVGDEAGLYRIRSKREDYGDGARCRFGSINRRRSRGHNDIDPKRG
jgi:hypothetical protein